MKLIREEWVKIIFLITGSFLLFCMILAFLREQRRDLESEGKLNQLHSISIGESLIKFFEYYGVRMNW